MNALHSYLDIDNRSRNHCWKPILLAAYLPFLNSITTLFSQLANLVIMIEDLYGYRSNLMNTCVDMSIISYCHTHRIAIPLVVLEDHESKRTWLISCVDELIYEVILIFALVERNSELWILGIILVLLGLCRKLLGRRGEEDEEAVYLLARVRSVGIVILCVTCVEAILGLRMLWYIWGCGWEMWGLRGNLYVLVLGLDDCLNGA